MNEHRQRLKDEFEFYARNCLFIRAKSGATSPLVMNQAQKHIHERIEAQLARTGRVRALVLKGRQQGCSTYIEGRFYWKVSHRCGVVAFILTHEQEATNNLFAMADRYHKECPPFVRPATGAANAKELIFDGLGSGYKVGTAGTKGVGRSSTIQYFHGSEVAFWPHADTHAAGAMQAVPNEPGTEIILESTANGLGNLFHERWQSAERGDGEYIAIFVPWHWQEEYQIETPDGFTLEPDEKVYAETYNLTDEQMAWRRNKIAELGSDWMFKQEYPANSAEAFQTSGENVLISPQVVMTARNSKVVKPHGPLLVGVDPARFGDDRTSIIRRQGRKASKLESYSKKDTMEVVGLVLEIIKTEKPRKVFIDVGGLGAGVVDRLNELGYSSTVVAVNSGSKPMNGDRFTNKRAEMWGEMKDWFDDEAGVDIPDSNTLHADLTGPTYSYDSNTRLRIEKKEDMKRRGIKSPDEADALALTFALPVTLHGAAPLDYSKHNKGIV